MSTDENSELLTAVWTQAPVASKQAVLRASQGPLAASKGKKEVRFTLVFCMHDDFFSALAGSLAIVNSIYTLYTDTTERKTQVGRDAGETSAARRSKQH